MYEKNNYWTIIMESKKDYPIKCYSKKELFEELNLLQTEGADMDDVKVFPPQCNLTLAELIEII
ncbi:hypothetical protein [Peribacillus frigoritolerans]|uniref:hypothetical protein n=1 Tax=Peribacillus frigoritolerans TaxID=450367 RepID=UPI002079986A|nr:hypothetical protein [Peribacillus frigoritolerans]USK77725.1 hypothetical protein LIT31_26585 [Peribacillus frigoritolerans]USK77802.1 hypothetical protein LIT31_26105 [Peribacillus frigoritolerans]